MPELPEVETIRRGLQKQIILKKISKISIKKPNLVKHSSKFFRNVLEGNQFSKIERIGKLLIFKLKFSKPKYNQYLIIHLKMTGQLIYCDDKNFVAGGHANSKKEENLFFRGDRNVFCKEGKYTHIVFEFRDKSKLFFNDLRQFGYLKIVNGKELQKIKKGYGIEPGQKNFTFQNFQEKLQKRRMMIKAFLLNQTIISGLGNIYVDESLFSAKIHPQQLTNSLSAKEQKLLFNSIKKIIKLAIENKGTTFSDFVDNSGRRGNFKQKLKVYGRQGKKCLRKHFQKDGTRYYPKIKKIKVVGRGTHFCPVCQRIEDCKKKNIR